MIFYTLVFVLAFGPALVLAGPGAFSDPTRLSGTDAEVATAADLGPVMLVAAVAGPLVYALIAVSVVALSSGRAALHGLRSRLFRRRVGPLWYAFALLAAPLVWVGIQGALSLTSAVYVPGIVTADDPTALLGTALVAGVVAGLFEEIAWTGFATEDLLKRHGVVAAGLIVGLLWSVLHLPLYAGAAYGAVPRELAVPVNLFAWLLPYRVLVAWAYSHTRSVLVAALMHAPMTTLGFLLGSAAMAGAPDVVFNLLFGAALWSIVAAVTAVERRRSRRLLPAPSFRGAEGELAGVEVEVPRGVGVDVAQRHVVGEEGVPPTGEGHPAAQGQLVLPAQAAGEGRRRRAQLPGHPSPSIDEGGGAGAPVVDPVEWRCRGIQGGGEGPACRDGQAGHDADQRE
ncbi:CPBP family intramembrane glutamic endopeptidase [Sinomonas sp. RB5]